MGEQPSNELFPADENTDLIPRVVRARRARGAIALVLGVGALGAAAVTFVVPANRVVAPETRTALEAQAKAVASALEAAAAAAHVRADRIATHDTVRAAIQTDAATAVDMMKSDFDHTPIKDEKLIQGETLELFQLVDGAPAALARMPAGAGSLAALAGQGTRVARMGDGVAVVVSAPVERFKDGPGYRPVDGLLVMASPVDLTFVGQAAAGTEVSAQLVGLGAPISLIAGPDTGEAPLPFAISIDKAWSSPLQLMAVPKTSNGHAAWVVPVRYAGLAAGVVLLVLAGLWLRGR